MPAPAQQGAPGIGDSRFPSLGNGGYEVSHYSLDLEFDGEMLVGLATLDIVPLVFLESFQLDLTGLTVAGVEIDGEVAGFELADELTVSPTGPLPAGQSVSVAIEYQGMPSSIPNVAGRFPVGWHKSVDGWFVLSEPAGADTWFPSNNHPLDKATFNLEVTVPEGLEVVSSGLMTGEETAPGEVTYMWQISDPTAPYLLALAIGDFDRVEDSTVAGVPVVNYFDRQIGASDRALFDRQPEMLEFFTGLFGDYPFDVYGALVLETEQVPAALESQTLSTFGTQILVLGEAVVAHELVHQWFGDSVSVADWGDIWLNEGFAIYGQWMWAEYTGGTDALDGEVVAAYRAMAGSGLSSGSEAAGYEQARDLYPPPGSPPADNLFNQSVYLRGGLTLHALRLRLGDPVFFELLETWATEHRHSNARTGDLLELVEELGGEEARELVEDWIFSRDLPPIDELGLRPPG
jgi:aminopeptidase N